MANNELYSNLESIQKIKQNIKKVLQDKYIDADDVFANYPNYIKEIKQASDIIDYTGDPNQLITNYVRTGQYADTKTMVIGEAQIGTLFIYDYEPYSTTYTSENDYHGVIIYRLDSIVSIENNTGRLTPIKKYLERKPLDTSDATATSNDLLAGVTAYVDNRKITGTIEPIADMTMKTASTVYVPQDDSTSLVFTSKMTDRGVIDKDVTYQLIANSQTVASAIGLAPDIIKNNVNILGVSGTYDSNPEEYNAKFIVGDMVTGLTPMKLLVSVEKLDTSNVTDASGIFSGCYSLGSVPPMNLDKATALDSTFYNCTNLVYMPELSIPMCKTLSSTFYNCGKLSQVNLSNTGNVYSLSSAFYNCRKIISIPNLNYSNCNSYYSTFDKTGLAGDIDMSFVNFIPNRYYSFTNTFNQCTEITSISNLNLAGMPVGNGAISTTNMFRGCSNLVSLDNVYLPNIADGCTMFSGCYNLTYINNSDMQLCQNYYYANYAAMFSGCSKLESVPSNIWKHLFGYNMTSMFSNCQNLKGIPSNITITANNTYYGYSSMFNGCHNLMGGVNLIFTNSSVSYRQFSSGFSSMFANCSNLTSLNIINHVNVASLSSTVAHCPNLHSFSVADSTISTSTLLTMSGTFNGCHNLKSMANITGINWANVGSYTYTFTNCNSLSNVSAINTYSCTDATYLFLGCTNLTSVPALICDKMTTCNIFGTFSNAFSSSGMGYLPNLTDFGGFINIGKGYTTKTNILATYDVDLTPMPNLTYGSLKNIINGLYNLYTTFGVTPGVGTMYHQRLKIATIHNTKLTDADRTNITNKGWIINVYTNSYVAQ